MEICLFTNLRPSIKISPQFLTRGPTPMQIYARPPTSPSHQCNAMQARNILPPIQITQDKYDDPFQHLQHITCTLL